MSATPALEWLKVPRLSVLRLGPGQGPAVRFRVRQATGGHIKIYRGRSGYDCQNISRAFSAATLIDSFKTANWLGRSNGETILVDQADRRSRLSTDILRSLGYAVATAANPSLPRFAAKKLRFDLLLTDIVMPGMNGRELAESASKLRPGLKVIYRPATRATLLHIMGGSIRDWTCCKSRLRKTRWRHASATLWTRG